LRGRGQVVEDIRLAGAALRTNQIPFPLLQEPFGLVPSHRFQPVAEPPLVRTVIELANRLMDLDKNLLGDISRIRILQAQAPAKVVEERVINFHERIPSRRVVTVPNAQEQAGPGVIPGSVIRHGCILRKTNNLAPVSSKKNDLTRRFWVG